MCSALVGGEVAWPSEVSRHEVSARNQEVICSNSNKQQTNNEEDHRFPHPFHLSVEVSALTPSEEDREHLTDIVRDYTT